MHKVPSAFTSTVIKGVCYPEAAEHFTGLNQGGSYVVLSNTITDHN